MYDPTVGRFLEEDPIGPKSGDMNFYRYCGNSPTNFTDPQGLKKVIVVYVCAKAPSQSPSGHVFFEVMDTDTGATTGQIGFATNDTIDRVHSTYTGVVRDDSQNDWSLKREIQLTDEEYAKLLAAIAALRANPGAYDADTRNCTTVLQDLLTENTNERLPESAAGAYSFSPGYSPGGLYNAWAHLIDGTVTKNPNPGGKRNSCRGTTFWSFGY
jgi:hypothetical protein